MYAARPAAIASGPRIFCRRDEELSGIIQVRIVAAVEADDLERARVAAFYPAVDEARGLASQNGGAPMTGLTSCRKRDGPRIIHSPQPWVAGVIWSRRCGDRIPGLAGQILPAPCRFAWLIGPPRQQSWALPGSGAALPPRIFNTIASFGQVNSCFWKGKQGERPQGRPERRAYRPSRPSVFLALGLPAGHSFLGQLGAGPAVSPCAQGAGPAVSPCARAAGPAAAGFRLEDLDLPFIPGRQALKGAGPLFLSHVSHRRQHDGADGHPPMEAATAQHIDPPHPARSAAARTDGRDVRSPWVYGQARVRPRGERPRQRRSGAAMAGAHASIIRGHPPEVIACNRRHPRRREGPRGAPRQRRQVPRRRPRRRMAAGMGP